MAEIKLQTIAFEDNSVIISLTRYNELVQKELDLSKKTVYIKQGWFKPNTVYTSSKATKMLALELQKSYDENEKLRNEISELCRDIADLKKQPTKLTLWERLWKSKA
jgi:hypothetical protein